MKAHERLQVMEIILSVIAGICMYFSTYLVGTVLGDTSTLYKMFPAVITYLLPVYLLFVLHLIMFPKNPKKLHSTIKVNGLVMGSLSFVSLVLVVVYLIKGVYFSLVEGSVTALYPLDLILIDLLVMALGIWLLLSERKMHDEDFLYFAPRGKLAYSIINSIVKSFVSLVSLYFMGAFILSFGNMNYGSSTAPLMIPFYVLFFLMSLPLLADNYLFRNDDVLGVMKKKWASILSGIIVIDLLALIICWVKVPSLLAYEAQPIFFPDFMLEKFFAPYFIFIPALIEIAYLMVMGFKKSAK
jgi:hypothetical protein